MYRLEVIADKLNIRNTPEADPDFKNWIGDMTKGETYTAIDVVKGGVVEGTDDWFVDTFNRFTSAAGVKSQFQNWMVELRLPDIWEIATGKGVGIAVVDTGITPGIADLPFSVAKQFVFDLSVPLVDTDGHGTNCAGLIGARNTNANYIGAAPGCNLFIAKISEKGDFDNPVNDALRYAAAITWCANQPEIHIISISWGHMIELETVKTRIREAIDLAISKNKIILCSIGDAFRWGDSTAMFPACFDNTIGIGSKPVLNVLYPFINDQLDFVTAGAGITSYGINESSRHLSGTSQSNAICAGIVALLVQKMNFSFSLSKIRNALTAASKDISYTIKNKTATLRVLDGDLLLKIFKSGSL